MVFLSGYNVQCIDGGMVVNGHRSIDTGCYHCGVPASGHTPRNSSILLIEKEGIGVFGAYFHSVRCLKANAAERVGEVTDPWATVKANK